MVNGFKGFKEDQVGIPGVNMPEDELIKDPVMKTPDNRITNQLVDEGKLPASERETFENPDFTKGINSDALNLRLDKNVSDNLVTPLEEKVDIKDPFGGLKGPEKVEELDITGKSVPDTSTGIEEIDTNIDKLREEKDVAIKDTFDSFNIAKGQFQQDKDKYTNFDDINTKFEGVLDDIRSAQDNGTDLTDEQYQLIATKYGLSIDQIKNPQSIFNELEFSEEGKKDFGITSAEESIAKLGDDFERTKSDLTTNLTTTKESLNNQLDDVGTQLERNIAWAEASGAWTGGIRSTGYANALSNIRNDGAKTVSRLESALDNTKTQYTTNIERLTTDYNKAIEDSKAELDSSIKDLKFDTGLKLNTLEGKFGLGTTELTNALDKINEEFGTKSLDVFNKYLESMQNIQTITENNITQQEKINSLLDQKNNKRYNALLENKGILLQNTNLTSLAEEVNNGTLSLDNYNNLKSIISSSINATLSKFGTVSPADLTTIESLLTQGRTPTQIIAQMQTLDKFKPSEDTPEVVDIGGVDSIFNPDTGKFEKIEVTTTTGGDANKNLTDLRKTDGTGTIQFTGNVGNDLNNPGNLVRGGIADKDAIGFVTVTGNDGVTRDFLVFPDLATGYKGVQSDLDAKISGNSRVITPNESLGRLLDVWVGGEGAGNNYKQVVANTTGLNLEEPIIGMDAGLILSGIKEAEGATGKVGNDYTGLIKQDSTGLTKEQQDNKDIILSQIKAEKATSSDITKFTETAIAEGWGAELSKAIGATGDTEKAEVFNKKIKEAGGDVLKIMEASAGGKKADQSFRTSFEKGITVISQLDSLSNQIFQGKDELVKDENGNDVDISPLSGWVRSKNPWDTDAQTIESTLTAIIPNLARGVYGEVGVLTDQDVELYKKTIPNLKQTDDVKKAILALTLRTVKNSLDNKIQINAGTGVDMSGLTDFYSRITDKLNKLESDIGITGTEAVIDTPTVEVDNFDDIYDDLLNSGK